MTSSLSLRPAGSCGVVKVAELREEPGQDLHRRIERAVDFLDYHFTREELRVEILLPRCKR